MEKYLTVKKYIDEMDYWGLLEDGAPGDEFDWESEKISGLITENSTAEEIARAITLVFHLAFGLEDREEFFRPWAEKIYRELNCGGRGGNES